MHMLDVNVPFPTSASSSTYLHQPQRPETTTMTTTTTTTAAGASSTIPIRQRPKLPRRSTSASNTNTSQGRRGGRVRKRTPSPSRRNGTCFDTTSFTENKSNNIVSLSALDIINSPAGGHRFSFDPSMYKLHNTLLSTCVDSANSVSKHSALHVQEKTAINLSSGRKITYNNARDVLHLRFVLGNRSCSSTTPLSPDSPPPAPTTYSGPTLGNILYKGVTSRSAASTPPTHPLSAIFQALWSPHLAEALHTARRIAINVSQIWPTLGDIESSSGADQSRHQHHSRLVQDIVFLACTIQDNLEVLYLVDSSSTLGGNSRRKRSGCNNANSLQSVKSSPLYRALHPSSKDPETHYHDTSSTNSNETEAHNAWQRLHDEQEQQRQPDVIRGVGKVWREVFDLEALGWHEKHPGFVFGETMGEVIRLQQGSWHGQGVKNPSFKGVRVLVAEDEEVVGDDTIVAPGSEWRH